MMLITSLTSCCISPASGMYIDMINVMVDKYVLSFVLVHITRDFFVNIIVLYFTLAISHILCILIIMMTLIINHTL